MANDTGGIDSGVAALVVAALGWGGCIGPSGVEGHGLPEGARLLSAKGEHPVEDLRPGDRVITRDYGMRSVRGLSRTRLAQGAALVCVPAGALGGGRPATDMLLPPGQAVILRDWRAKALFGAREVRIPIQRLMDGQLLRLVDSPGGYMWSVILDRPATLYVERLELVSAGEVGTPLGG